MESFKERQDSEAALTPGPAAGRPSGLGHPSGLGLALLFLPFTAPEPGCSEGRAGSSSLRPTCRESAGPGDLLAQPLFPQTSTRGSWRPPPPTFALNRMWEKGRGGPEVGSLSPSSPLSISLPVPVFQCGEHHAPLPCGPQLLCPCSDSVCHALGSPVSQEPRTPAFLGARSGAAREPSAESATIPCPALGPPLLTPCSGVSGRGQAWATGPVLSPSPSPGRPAILRNGHLSSLENLPDVGRKELA